MKKKKINKQTQRRRDQVYGYQGWEGEVIMGVDELGEEGLDEASQKVIQTSSNEINKYYRCNGQHETYS